MTKTIRVPIFGSKLPYTHQSRLKKHNENDELSSNNTEWPSYNVVAYIRNREYGTRQYNSMCKNHCAKNILKYELLKEYPVALKSTDSILCSQWINSRQIVFGTKCNKLMVYDINSCELEEISMNRHLDAEVHKQNGINSLKINPSRSLLATVGYTSNDIFVYELPTLKPIVLIKCAHRKEIHAIEWIDDKHFASGSHDSKLAIWRINYDKCNEEFNFDDDMKIFTKYANPIAVQSCILNNDIQGIVYNKHLKEILSISTCGPMHVWNVEYLKQTYSIQLSEIENICIAINNKFNLYAIGRISNTLVIDTRTLNPILNIPVYFHGRGIRSISFHDNIITIGTDVGVLMFYDVRQHKYLGSSLDLSTSIGYKVKRCFNSENVGRGQLKAFVPTINTHCYDYSRTKLFTAGGPAKDSIFGGYASLWF